MYSHGHIDHVFGVGVWEAESAERGWPALVVIAHEALPHRFDRYRMTTGYNEVINRRQFGVRDLRWPTEYRYPDRTYADTLTLDVGGSGFLKQRVYLMRAEAATSTMAVGVFRWAAGESEGDTPGRAVPSPR